MRFRTCLAVLPLLLAACSSGEEADAPEEAPGSEAAAGQAAPAEGGAAASAEAPRSLTAEEAAALAKQNLEGSERWQPGGPLEITGTVAEIILDAPPETFLAFGSNPSETIGFAEMKQPFASDQQYNREGFYDAEGRVTVSCTGAVIAGFNDGPPIFQACSALFRN